MCSKIQLFLALFAIGAFRELALQVVMAWPAPASASANHIVSFVHQKRIKGKQDEFPNFDFENIRNDVNGSQTPIERLVEELDMTQKNNNIFGSRREKINMRTVDRNQRLQQTDDSVDTSQNTLDNTNELFGNNNQHESPSMMMALNNTTNTSTIMWQRNKQSIPVLETVRHFVQSVRDGTLNHTIPNRNHNHHHQLIGNDHGNTMGSGGDVGVVSEHKSINKTEENPAIETEEERTHTEESTEFKLLEVLGSFGGILWNFLMSIQKFFAASSGGASAASSSQASASSSGGGTQ